MKRPVPLRRCTLLWLLHAVTVLSALGTAGHAVAEYPEKPVRMIVPFPAGGSLDTVSRIVARKLSVSLGQQFVVENRPGAGGGIGTALAAKAPADGYTILMGTISSHAINPALYAKLPYDPVRDFAPIAQVITMPNVLVVNPLVAADSVAALAALARARPGALTFASGGNGTTHHLCGELFRKLAQVEMTHVPYRGNAAAVTDLLGGQVAVMFDNISNSLPHIKAGKLRALAVTGGLRAAVLPEVPTMIEAGFPGYNVTSWFALFAPARTPPEIVRKLNAATVAALREKEVHDLLATEGIEATPSTPQELEAFVRAEVARWAKIVAESGAKVE
jgi:tripartite-type tricarboxylate transporter receptor subunit TctC